MAELLSAEQRTNEGPGAIEWEGVTNASVARSTTQFHGGAASIEASAVAAGEASIQLLGGTWPAVVGGRTCTGKLWVYWTGADHYPSFLLRYSKAGNNFLLDVTGNFGPTVAGQWVEYPVSGDAPADAENVRLYLASFGMAAGEKFYVDDASLDDGVASGGSTVTRAPTTNVGITGTWTNPQNAYSDDNVYATAAPGKNASLVHEFAGFDIGSVVPDGSAINNVTIRQRWFVSTNASIATLGSQAYVGATAKGTEFTNTTEPLSEILEVYSVAGLTRADLLDLRVRVRATRANTNTAYTANLDAVDVVVEYTAGSVSGTALVSGAGSVVVVGAKQSQQVAAVASPGSVLVSGAKTVTSSVAVTGTGTVVVTGGIDAPSVTGTASVTGTGQVSASGARSAVSSVSVAGGSQVGVEASRSAQTGSSVEGAGAVLVTGSKQVVRTVSTSGTGVVTAAGTADIPAAGSGVVLVTGAGSASVTGSKQVSGTASVSGTGSVAAAGSKQASKSVSVSGTGQVTTSGTAEQVSAVSVSGTGSVLVVGTKSYAVSPSLSGIGSVSVEYLASRGGTASVSALGLITVTSGSLRPRPATASVRLAAPRAVVEVVRDGATVTASEPSATTSSPAPSAVGG